MPGLRVTERSPRDVSEDERRAWAALEARAIEPNAYLSPHFVLPALRHLDADAPAIVVFVWDGDAAASLRAVGVFTPASPSRVCPLRHLVAYRSCHSYLSGLLIDRAAPAPTLAALLDALSRRWHAIVFTTLRGDGPLAALLRTVAAARATPAHELARRARAILRPRDAGAACLDGPLRARTGDARRLRRRLAEHGPIRWTVHRGGDALARCVDDHLALEGQGWKGAEQSALASRAAHAAFFREVAAGFGGEQRALFTELAVGDEVIAVTSNFVSGDAAFAFKLGWSAAWARFSPGVLNEVEFIRHADAVCRGLDHVDSGAVAGSFIDRLWLERGAIVDLVVPLDQAGRWSLAATAAARGLRRRRPRADAPTAIVLSCQGASEASLNVVRSLAAGDVRVVLLTEDAEDLAAASRHVAEVVHAPALTTAPREMLDAVAAIADRVGGRPVVFPTADPDLLLASRHRAALDRRCHVLAAPTAMLDTLMDKRRFAALAERLQLKVPRTFAPTALDQVGAIAAAARYPVIVKPSQPLAWNGAAVRAVVGPVKAIQVDDAAALIALCARIGAHDLDMLIQEWVPGPDENHVDLHALLDDDGEAIACFTGRKLRIHPPHAGSGCYVESVTVPAVLAEGLAALRRCRLAGLANVNFKQHAVTGEYLLLEINPRVSQWSILASKAGVNLPLLAFRQACGLPNPTPPRQRDGVRYVNLRKDLAAFRVYRREGTLSPAAYLRTLLYPGLVPQVFDPRDVGPWLRAGAHALRRLRARS